MEQRERDESSSKLEEALRELTGAETTGKIEEYENEREGTDVDSETACTDMRHAERMRPGDRKKMPENLNVQSPEQMSLKS